jgi:methylated-DNA-[protein]-cysteine S-methyltransferase
MRAFTIAETELGWVGLMQTATGLRASTLPLAIRDDALRALDPNQADVWVEPGEFGPAVQCAADALAGRRQSEPVALDLSGGTSFQRAVWTTVLGIPFGQTRSYGWVAEAIGRPLGAHAVGQAIGRNPLPLFIPCHRVIAADGSLGGYGPGPRALPTKRFLLRREGVYFDGLTLDQLRDRQPARSEGGKQCR